MSVTRRDALKGLIALTGGAALASAGCGHSSPPARTAPKPRKLVVVFLSGGPDGVLTLDPKSSSEIEPWVDNPLPRDNMIVGNTRLGALWAPLARWGTQMATVHGVQVESANHFAGTWQLLRLRRRGMQSTPGILDLVARHHESPLGAITVGNIFNRTFTPSWMPLDGYVAGTGARQGLSQFDDVPADELRALADVMRENAKNPSLRTPDRASYERVVAYLEGLERHGKFVPSEWKTSVDKFDMPQAVTGMQRVLWALEHDLASSALVYFGFNTFDSHWENLRRQKGVNGVFARAFDRFLEELRIRKNAHGSLLEQTTVVVAGEVGRHPRINSDQGKDHLPEISLLLMGAGVQTGTLGNVVGRTGRDMMGLPIDLATGAIGGDRYLTLDDVGTTVLRMFSIEPTQYGYPSRPIEPLLV